MPRSGTLGNPQSYASFGVFAGLPFWDGGLALLAAAALREMTRHHGWRLAKFYR
jgi:hypothetical protein